MNEFNTTVFDQISHSYQRLPEPTKPTPEPTPLPEPSIDSITTPSPPADTSSYEEDLNAFARSSHSGKEEDEDGIERHHHHESLSVATVRWFNRKRISKHLVKLCSFVLVT